jgi:hypothetical protein
MTARAAMATPFAVLAALSAAVPATLFAVLAIRSAALELLSALQATWFVPALEVLLRIVFPTG